MKAAKSVTAKLLATENITVVQDKVRTASFDVKNRVLTLPLWADAESYTEDHLIGHEVGHALYTPLEGWHDAVCDKGANYKSFLNVVEDARIEKLIQRKYAGLRPLFIKSYRKLLADGFFGGTIDAINDMGLIDRINTYFKCGMSAGVEFAADEQQWLPRIDALETWEEVVALTDELFEFCKQKQEEQQQAEQDAAEADAEEEDGDAEGDSGFGDDDGDEFGDEFDFDFEDGESDQESTAGGTDGEGDEESTAPAQQGDAEGQESDDDEESQGESPAKTNEGGKGVDFDSSEPRSHTDESLRDAVDQMADTETREVYNYTIQAPKYSDHIISYKRILEELRGVRPLLPPNHWAHSDDNFMDNFRQTCASNAVGFEKVSNFLYKNWLATNKKAVNHMVKEFEMKKQASEFARASTAKTGVIDTIKMNNYKLTDDIFKKVTVLPEGKNHAFVMFLDMSGSMADYMYETVEQTLLLASFCRQIGVPFRVYGFSDRLSSRNWGNNENTAPLEYYIEEGIALLELFSNEQNKRDFSEIAGRMLTHYACMGGHYDVLEKAHQETGYYPRTLRQLTCCFDLGGTPLDSAIVLGIPLINDFRAKTRADVMNVVFLTDGASHEMEINGRSFRNSSWMSRSHVTITSPYSNQTFKSRTLGARMTTQTELLLEMMKAETGANMLGYFITRQSKGSAMQDYNYQSGRNINWEKRDELWKQMREDGFLPVTTVGYDDFFIVGHKSLKIEDNKMDDAVAGEVSKAKLRTMFKKAQVGGKKSRKMLNDIVARVA